MSTITSRQSKVSATLKKVYSILVLLTNFLIRRNNYNLGFYSKKFSPIKLWYYNFKHWGFHEGALRMVSGADKLCEIFSKDNDRFTIKVKCYRKPVNLNEDHWLGFKAEDVSNLSIKDRYLLGRNYQCVNRRQENMTMWICPVTLFVLGRYPKYLYVKKD